MLEYLSDNLTEADSLVAAIFKSFFDFREAREESEKKLIAG